MVVKIYTYKLQGLVTKEEIEHTSTWSLKIGDIYEIFERLGWWRVLEVVNISEEVIKK